MKKTTTKKPTKKTIAKPPVKKLRQIVLDPIEAAELRVLDSQRQLAVFQAAQLRQMADGMINAAETLIKERATQFAMTAGVDINKEANGWNIDINRGVIEEKDK